MNANKNLVKVCKKRFQVKMMNLLIVIKIVTAATSIDVIMVSFLITLEMLSI